MARQDLPGVAQAGTGAAMSASLRVPPSSTVVGLNVVGVGAVMLLPLMLLHAHGIAEGMIAVADACFLAWCTLQQDWRWLRPPGGGVAGTWWLWLVFCSLPIPALHLGEGSLHSSGQALAVVRFLVLAAAMEHLLLRREAIRNWLYALTALSVVWIAVNCMIQMITGAN